MRLAFLAWTSIEPPDSGYRVRARAILRHLPVEDLLVISPPPEIENLNHLTLSRPWTARLPLPFNGEVLLFQSATKARQKAVKALRDFRPDLVWCEGLWSFPPAMVHRRQNGTPVIVGVQNIEFVAAMPQGKRTVKSSILQKLEQRTYSSCDALVACSKDDGRNLHSLFSVSRQKILILPNGIEPYEKPPKEDVVELRQEPDEKVLLFLGKLDYAPNREAVEWMLRALLPLLGRLRRRFCLAIVGGPPLKAPAGPLPANVRLHLPGKVPQIEPYLQAADVCLAPIFSGSGTRIKVLEYLRAEKPVIATSKAVEGIELKPGKHFELAEDAPETAGAIARLLNHPEQARDLATQGRLLVERHYLWRHLVEEFYEALQRLLEK